MICGTAELVAVREAAEEVVGTGRDDEVCEFVEVVATGGGVEEEQAAPDNARVTKRTASRTSTVRTGRQVDLVGVAS